MMVDPAPRPAKRLPSCAEFCVGLPAGCEYRARRGDRDFWSKYFEAAAPTSRRTTPKHDLGSGRVGCPS